MKIERGQTQFYPINIVVLLKQMTRHVRWLLFSISALLYRLSENQVYDSNRYQINDRTLETSHIATWFVIFYSYVYGIFPILTELVFSKINTISSCVNQKKLVIMNVWDIYISI